MALATVNGKQYRVFEIGAPVAWRESILFGGRIHKGSVVSVTFAPNGYPVTVVNFPTLKGEMEFDVYHLADADQYEANVSWWAN